MASNSIEDVRFCIRCGSSLLEGERFGKVRPYCPVCGWTFFPDPKVAAAGLIQNDHKVLLVRRANDPQRGLWTLPAGFVDAGEDPARAVERECREETGLDVRAGEVLQVISGLEHPRGAHILIVYRAEVVGGTLHADDDVDRAAFFRRNELPPLAFSTTQKVFDRWLEG